MLLVLYVFMDTLSLLFTLMVCFSCLGAMALLTEEIILNGVGGRNHWITKNYEIKYVGDVSIASLIGFIFGASVATWWFITRNWILNNLMAASICLVFLKSVRLNSLVPGLVLLGLLFFYDIFWVFFSSNFTGGESVMVAVAKGLDIPIKLWMPHLTADFPTTACSLLGLGDIIIPGIFISFMTRFGLEAKRTHIYFYAAMFAYTSALFACGASLFIYG